MKKLLVLMLFAPMLLKAQQKIVLTDTLKLSDDFSQQVKDGMGKHHKKYRSNDFYNFNTDKKPKYESADTIIYGIKLLTSANGTILWDAKCVFSRAGEKLVIQVSDLKMLKKSSMRGVDYINVSVDDLEDTKGNRVNLSAVKSEVEKFFRRFAK